MIISDVVLPVGGKMSGASDAVNAEMQWPGHRRDDRQHIHALKRPAKGRGMFGRGIRKVFTPFPCRSFPCHLGHGIGIPCWNRTSLCGFAGRRLNGSANGMLLLQVV
jgi:hypothetical protein